MKQITMSIQYKPDIRTEKQYDREAEQLVKYLSGFSSKGEVDVFWKKGYELFASSASIPYMNRLDERMAKEGEP
jgi:hypothetical protein